MEVRGTLTSPWGPEPWLAWGGTTHQNPLDKTREARRSRCPECCKGLLESSHLNEPTPSLTVAPAWAQNRQEQR